MRFVMVDQRKWKAPNEMPAKTGADALPRIGVLLDQAHCLLTSAANAFPKAGKR